MPRLPSSRLILSDALEVMASIYGLTFGLLLLAGGSERLKGPFFSVLINWAPPEMWGVAIATCSALTSSQHHHWLRWAGWSGLALVFWLWEAASALGALRTPSTPLTGVPTYAFIAAIYTVFAVLNVREFQAAHTQKGGARE